MSFNQSRSDKSETQYRKTGRSASSNQHRNSSGAYGRGAGGGPAPSPSTTGPSLSSNRSFKKSNNAHGGQSKVGGPPLNPSESTNASVPRNVQNGAHVQPQLHGASDAPVPGGAPKSIEASAAQRISRAVPKSPTSQSATLSSDNAAPSTPSKTNDASKAFSFQFGSISPGFVNGMQIPARTSSAPPNLDEQKRDQARQESFRSVPHLPTPVPKQPLPRKDSGTIYQSSAGEAHLLPKVKKDAQVSPASQTQKQSVLPIPMTSMQMPFHQPPVPLQFGGPNPQIQSQSINATSLQMPIPMPVQMGNSPQVQPPMFVPGLQPHPMPPQGIIHQGQGLSFTNQMGPQLTPQLGNLGLSMSPQYPQQQGGKFGGPRKTTTVKITHPKTHEELRLDKLTDTHSDAGSSGPRSHPNVPSQSQPIPSFAPSHPINYYPNSYNGSSLFFTAANAVPITSSPIAPNSQAPRFNYPVSQGPQNVAFMNPAAHGSLPVNKSGGPMHGVAEPPNLENARDVHSMISPSPSGSVQVIVKPAPGPVEEKIVDRSLPRSSLSVEKGESPISSESSLHPLIPGSSLLAPKSLPGATKESNVVAAAAVESVESSAVQCQESVPAVTITEDKKMDILSRSNSIKEQQKKPVRKGHILPHQVGGQSTSVTSLSSQTSEHNMSTNCGTPETVQFKTTLLPSEISQGFSESAREALSAVDASTSLASFVKKDSATDGLTSSSFRIVTTVYGNNCLDSVHHANLGDFSTLDEQGRLVALTMEEQEEKKILDKQDISNNEISAVSVTSSSLGSADEIERVSVPDASGVARKEIDESVGSNAEAERISSNTDVSTSRILDSPHVESSHVDNLSSSNVSSSKSGIAHRGEISVDNSGISDRQSTVPASQPLEATSSVEGEGMENVGSGFPVLGSKDNPILEPSRGKNTTAKKKRKEVLQKADAAGSTSDLYGAYKGPEEKKEIVMPVESTEYTSKTDKVKQAPSDVLQVETRVSEEGEPNKVEPDDWEDAADISTPNLQSADNTVHVHGLLHQNKDGNENMKKKYSRDFLLKFAEQCMNLPEGFDIASAEALISANFSASQIVDRDSYPAPGRTMDRSSGGSRIDRRASAMVDDDRWSKLPGPFGAGRDLRLDIGYGANAGFRPGQGGNYGVLRNPRGQAPVQYSGGILSGPLQSMGSQGGMPRNSPDADRWQRAASFQQKGLIPSPQTPLQMMHKAERKYEVGKVTDEEEAKQRQLKAILNKLTPQNFEKLFEQVKAVNIDKIMTLNGVISQIFEKALMEPTFCEMYANFCFHLADELPDFTEEKEKITFKRLLLNKCQEEFERGEREQEEANKVEEEGEIKQSKEEREEKRTKARRRMLGNIRLIGELYKKRMLTDRIMHSCIKKLLGEYQNPDEEDIEALCKLMSTIGEMIDNPKAKEHMDAYFDVMAKLSNNMKLSSRLRFMLKDAIDLRKDKWQQRRKVEGPKKIEEVHRDAAQERQAQVTRLGRGPGINPSSRRGPMDFGPRGSAVLSSPNSQLGGFRGLPAQGRAYGTQDVRLEERLSYESRTLSVPLPQRPMGDDSITLGPQGGLARGMSIRGPPAMSAVPVADISSTAGDPRRMAAGLNGFNSVSERATYGAREDVTSRYVPNRFPSSATYDQPSAQERSVSSGNRDLRDLDRSSDRSSVTLSPVQGHGAAFIQNPNSEKVWPEDRLRDMSIEAIKEFYSVRDEKEVVSCIKDLNSPSFHPSMISLWVTDSFERKQKERDLLAKLLVSLTKSGGGVLSQAQLIKGFESVLTTLEDAVNDAPRAAEFLGHIFGKAILENAVTLREIGRLISEGGEEPGRLVEVGLGGDVLGNTLDMIKAEKGETILDKIRMSSDLRLEDFRPPDPNRSRMLEKFI